MVKAHAACKQIMHREDKREDAGKSMERSPCFIPVSVFGDSEIGMDKAYHGIFQKDNSLRLEREVKMPNKALGDEIHYDRISQGAEDGSYCKYRSSFQYVEGDSFPSCANIFSSLYRKSVNELIFVVLRIEKDLADQNYRRNSGRNSARSRKKM